MKLRRRRITPSRHGQIYLFKNGVDIGRNIAVDPVDVCKTAKRRQDDAPIASKALNSPLGIR